MIASTLIFAILAVHTFVWVLIYLGFSRAHKHREASPGTIPSVAIIIAVKNEAHNIMALVDSLAAQTHRPAEIVIVDDGSSDDTLVLLNAEVEAVRISAALQTSPDARGKKHALSIGIASTTSELLVFTDADCRPDPDWIDAIIRSVPPDELDYCIVGYSPFEGNGLIGAVSGYETFLTGVLTAASVGLNHPYMAVGRNIAYTRSAFGAVDGFTRIMHSLSGDDDLLVQEFRRDGIRVVHAFDEGSIVKTSAPESWKEWISQKLRHTSAGKFYSTSTSLALAVFHFTNVLLYLAPLTGPVGWSVLAFKLVLEWSILASAARTLKEIRLLLVQPVLHLIYILYIVLIAPVGVLRKRTKW